MNVDETSILILLDISAVSPDEASLRIAEALGGRHVGYIVEMRRKERPALVDRYEMLQAGKRYRPASLGCRSSSYLVHDDKGSRCGMP